MYVNYTRRGETLNKIICPFGDGLLVLHFKQRSFMLITLAAAGRGGIIIKSTCARPAPSKNSAAGIY